MNTAKLSQRGQVSLPKSICEDHHWQVGTEFSVEDTAEGILLRPLKPFRETRLEEVVGCAGYAGPRLSQEDMDRAIDEEIEVRHERGRY